MKKTNVFHDINKFPKWEWILWMPISMSRISNSQNASHIIKYLRGLDWKISATNIWVIVVYTDSLYLNNWWDAYAMKKKMAYNMYRHKAALTNQIKKPHKKWDSDYYFIEKAFSFKTRSDYYISIPKIFELLKIVKNRLLNDTEYLKLLYDDSLKKTLSEWDIDFFIEEHVIATYLISTLNSESNEFSSQPTRKLLCYPWPIMKNHAYILQNDLLSIWKTENPYQFCHYDIEKNVLYDIQSMDIKTYDYSPWR